MQSLLACVALAGLAACSDPMEKSARPEQIEKFQAVLVKYPELNDDFARASSDGDITKGELLNIANKANRIREARARP